MWLLYVLYNEGEPDYMKDKNSRSIYDCTIDIELKHPNVIRTLENFEQVKSAYPESVETMLSIEEKLKSRMKEADEVSSSEKVKKMVDENKELWDKTIQMMINGIYSSAPDQAENDLFLMLDEYSDKSAEEAFSRAGDILKDHSYGFWYRVTHW